MLLARFLSGLVLSVVAFAGNATEASTVSHSQGPGYHLYRSGPAGQVAQSTPRGGVLMMGGGDYFPQAFAWLFEHGGHGRLVVLRASGEGDLNPFFMDEIGGVAAVDTLVFSGREASSDPTVLEIVKAADMIFIGGGDQANYVNFWRGTPMQDAINAHVAANKPIGGTSAGLAVQGAWVYGALDGGSITTPETLADPLGEANTLIDAFLALPHLQNVITDSHFMPRERLGRLIGWVARLRAQTGNTALIGIGVDEATALAVEADGHARVLTGDAGKAWLIEPTQAASVLVAGEPLSIDAVRVTGLDTDSRYHLPSGKVDAASDVWTANVDSGTLTIKVHRTD
ncbi:MAG: cyanophycinase [Lysobacteraceae bacterium]